MFTSLFIALTMLSTSITPSAEPTATPTTTTIAVEKATFCGNDINTFSTWVCDRLVYPEASRENGSEGIVNVSFNVDETGRVNNVKVIKPFDSQLDAEVIRVVSMSPRWKPMKVNGKPVERNYTIGVNFKLTHTR